jgi:hypothetical protein
MTPFEPVTGNTYVNQYTNYELEQDELKTLLTRRDTQMSTVLNLKTNGIYETVELQNGEQFFSTDNTTPKRFVYRKVVPIPAFLPGPVAVLPIAAPGTSGAIPHAITGVTLFTRIYGIAVTAGDWRPIPNSDIKIVVTPTTYTITNEATSAVITSGIVILEYVKQ